MTAIKLIREDIERYGINSAKNLELLTLILGEEHAKKVYESLPHIPQAMAGLARMNTKQVQASTGISQASAAKLKASFEIWSRTTAAKEQLTNRISCARDAYQLMKPKIAHLLHEEFWIILLTRSNTVMQHIQISKGGVSGTVADPKLIFSHALNFKASALILVHNHPSGNKQPSQADIQLTKKAKQAGEMLEISVLDHVICTDDGYFSFNDEGML